MNTQQNIWKNIIKNSVEQNNDTDFENKIMHKIKMIEKKQTYWKLLFKQITWCLIITIILYYTFFTLNIALPIIKPLVNYIINIYIYVFNFTQHLFTPTYIILLLCAIILLIYYPINTLKAE